MTSAVCAPPGIIPEFSSYFRKESNPVTLALDDGTAPEACSTTLKVPDTTNCASFTAWSQYTASFAGLLGTAAGLVSHFAPPKLAPVIVGSIKALYLAVAGVNAQFLVAIHDINIGTAYNPVPGPDPIPPFPDPTKGNDIAQTIESAWDMLKPFIEKAISKLAVGSPWIKILEGLIASSDTIIAQIKTLFATK